MNESLLRSEVAACIRMLEGLGLIDFSGHVSARIEGRDELLINSRAHSRCTVQAADLIKITFAGDVLEGSGEPPLELSIHTEVYKARPDVLAVAHIHPAHTIALSIARRAYLPVIYHGAIFAGGVPVYDDCRHVNSPQRGREMAEIMGRSRAVIIRGHGATVAAESVKGVFFAAVYLEDNAEKLCKAYALGEPQALRADELAEGPRIWRQPQFDKVWSYYQAKTGVE